MSRRLSYSDTRHAQNDLRNSPEQVALNVIIPLGGRGERFRKQGYLTPKPMIEIANQPMLSWVVTNLRFEKGDILFLAMKPELEDQFAVVDLLRKMIPRLDIVYVPLNFVTRGAAETLYIVTQHMTTAQLQRRTISLDCDTIYFADILSSVRNLPVGCGCSIYFKDEQCKPIFSYISLADAREGLDKYCPSEYPEILDIAEKVRISDNANTGGYAFPTAALLQTYLCQLLAEEIPKSGEFYTSEVIARMLKSKVRFRGILASDTVCVGTPAQLQSFLSSSYVRD